MLVRSYRLLLTGLVFACLLPASRAAGETANPAAKPLPRKDAWWMNRHDTFVKRAAKGDAEVVFLGDSITHGWEGNGKKVWAEVFAPMKAVNFGIGGDQTGHVLWRITEGKELEGITPKAAVIMIGTNNIGGHTAEQIAGGVKAIVDTLRKQKPNIKILLLAVFPRAGKRIDRGAKGATAEELQPKVGKINAILAKMDDGKAVFYKDIGGKFLDKEGGLSKAIMPDYLHLSEKGYRIWADAIKADVEKLRK
jgi:lysophospholipase L1-like esterase